ncbi:MAG: glycosyltransferase, partial [Candidatus Neomarinimicrobiota bacterium]
SGEMHEPLMAIARNCPNLVLPGWIEKDEINTLLEVSKAGVLPYPSSLDFIRSYPNKVGEYLSKNLPIISSVQGAMDELISKFNIGITYKNNSPQSLVETIQYIEDNEDVRKSMSENAGRCFTEMFDAENVYNDYISYIEKTSKNL